MKEESLLNNNAVLAKDQKISQLENKLADVRESEVLPAADALSKRKSALLHAKEAAGWFPSSAQKEHIARLERETDQAALVLQRAEARALDLHSRLKPLYGIISTEYYEEQKAVFKKTLGFVSDAGYNNAWWSTLFNSRHESLSDLIIGFFVQWILSALVIYIPAGIWFLGWNTPWALWAYSSSWTDFFVGLFVWCLSVVVYLIPPALIIGAVYLLLRGGALQRQQQRAQTTSRTQYTYARGIEQDRKYR